MFGFYEAIKTINPNAKNMTFTVVNGDHVGEKAILSGSEIIWKSKDPGFFDLNKHHLANVSENGTSLVTGEMVYAETLGNEKKMVICGGGHVSIPIIKIALMVGFHVTVIEDRPMFADNARAAGAQNVICQDFETALADVQGDADTFFVIVTRGHKYDQDCLRAIAMKPHGYMGMIGSRRRIALVKELLIEHGIPAEKFLDLHAPIGLDIGSQTPEEIAVSILAEIIQVKSQAGRVGGYTPEILKAIINKEDADSMVLATIIRRSGSAPRDVGTKMLVLKGGRILGTVGGGCAEARVMRRALQMMRADGNQMKIFHVDLAADTAEEEGMVCGGQIDVLLEKIL